MSTNIVDNVSVQAHYAALFAFDLTEVEHITLALYPTALSAPYGITRIRKYVDMLDIEIRRLPGRSLDAKVAKREHVEALRKLQKRRY